MLDRAFLSVAWLVAVLSGWLHRTQSGRLRYYLAVAAFGVLVFVAVGLLR